MNYVFFFRKISMKAKFFQDMNFICVQTSLAVHFELDNEKKKITNEKENFFKVNH